MRITSVYVSLFAFEWLRRSGVFEIVLESLRIGNRCLFGFDVMIRRCDGRILSAVYSLNLCFFRFRGYKDFQWRLFS